MEDDDDDTASQGSFWGGRDPDARGSDERAFRPGNIICKTWEDHDPDKEAAEILELEEQTFEDEGRKNYAAAFTESVPDEDVSSKVSMTQSVKKDCVKRLMALEMSTVEKINRHLVRRVMSMFVDDKGKVVTVEDPLWTYIMNRCEHVVSASPDSGARNILFQDSDGEYVFIDVVPENPGSISDLLVAKHRLDPDVFRTAPECVVKPSKKEQDWWNDITVDRRPYSGDLGGSECAGKDKTDESMVKPDDVTKDDQKKFTVFYRDHVDQSCEGILPHRKLVKPCPSPEEVDAHLDKYFRPEGKMSDLYPIMNCGAAHLWKRPEAEAFKNYLSLGEPIWHKTPIETIPDSNGEACFRRVGKHSPIGGGKPEEESSGLSRRVTKIMSELAEEYPDAADDLIGATQYVMPATGEQALTDSLYGQSAKQKVAHPPEKLRQYMRYIAFEMAKDMPLSRWALDSFPVGEVMSHFIDAADDKSIGWTGLLYPGTRKNIQDDVNKRCAVIDLVKFRMALRFSVANSLHSYSPTDMVRIGLRDPCVAFVKGEGHPPRKKQTKTWRVIWVLSEVDRLIDTATYTEQDKMDIAHFQTGPRAQDGQVQEPGESVYPCATGVGHDDQNLQRTYFELETLLAKGGGHVHSSDATGWDLSVSSTTFWSAMETRLCRSMSAVQTATYLINGLVAASLLVSTGTVLWESCRLGITPSGSPITTSGNSQGRSIGSKAAASIEEIGGLAVFLQLVIQQIQELAKKSDCPCASTGDDLLNSKKHNEDVISAVGTIERKAVLCDGTREKPIDYLSHHYFKEDGHWRCNYNNGEKLLHRVADMLTQPYTDRSADDKVRIQAAVAGQRFVLRHTPRLEQPYLALVRKLAPEMPIPLPEDNGEA